MIPDPEDKKPDDWEDIPKTIPDPDATKPADWDDSEDGEWTAPEKPNPEYRGEWRPKMIPNPAYKVRACGCYDDENQFALLYMICMAILSP
jgi:calreticulin